MAEHTVKTYESELNSLAVELLRMGAHALAQITDALQAFVRADLGLAQKAVESDAGLDAFETQIEQRAIRIIALRQPMAQDLRQIVAAIKIAGNLERCGDLAKNIAKRSIAIGGADSPTLVKGVERLGELAIARLRQTLAAFAAHDAREARAVWLSDDEIDRRYDELFRELLALMTVNRVPAAQAAHLLFIAKNLERIGDHVTNICELVIYQVTGEDMRDASRPKTDSVAG